MFARKSLRCIHHSSPTYPVLKTSPFHYTIPATFSPAIKTIHHLIQQRHVTSSQGSCCKTNEHNINTRLFITLSRIGQCWYSCENLEEVFHKLATARTPHATVATGRLDWTVERDSQRTARICLRTDYKNTCSECQTCVFVTYLDLTWRPSLASDYVTGI